MIMIGAVVAAVVAVLAIVWHFATAPEVQDPFRQLAQLNVAPAEPRGTPPPPPPTAPPPGESERQPQGEPPAAAPSAVMPPSGMQPQPPTQPEGIKQDLARTVVEPLIPRRLEPEYFVFMPLPFDAPLAEFPLVLVWQKNREWYRIRDFDLDGRLSPTELDMLGRTRDGFFGDLRPPGGGELPSPEESPSGL